MDAEFFNNVLEQNKDAVREQVKQSLLDSIKRQNAWELPDQVKKEVAAFMEKEVLPEIRNALLENKDEIVSAATECVRSVPAEIGKAMQKQVAENLTSSWKLRGVI